MLIFSKFVLYNLKPLKSFLPVHTRHTVIKVMSTYLIAFNQLAQMNTATYQGMVQSQL